MGASSISETPPGSRIELSGSAPTGTWWGRPQIPRAGKYRYSGGAINFSDPPRNQIVNFEADAFAPVSAGRRRCLTDTWANVRIVGRRPKPVTVRSILKITVAKRRAAGCRATEPPL